MNSKPLTPPELEALVDRVASDMANPPLPAEFANRLQQQLFAALDAQAAPTELADPQHRSPHMNLATPELQPAGPFGNVLPFQTLDRAAGPRQRSGTVSALLLHAAALLLVGWYTLAHTNLVVSHPAALTVALVEPVPPPPLKLPPQANTQGGGGGHHDLTPVAQGRIPPPSPQTLNPPKIHSDIDPKINIPITVDIPKDLHMASNLPNFGNPNSPVVGTGSLGMGKGAGIGNGSGNGVGEGMGGGIGGGLKRPGGGVSNPIVLFAPEPEFSEEARKAKVAGDVLVYLQVDTQGHPTHVHVIRGIGMGLDEKAVEAVRQYRFKPAMENGHPVAVEMNVEVGFQIF